MEDEFQCVKQGQNGCANQKQAFSVKRYISVLFSKDRRISLSQIKVGVLFFLIIFFLFFLSFKNCSCKRGARKFFELLSLTYPLRDFLNIFLWGRRGNFDLLLGIFSHQHLQSSFEANGVVLTKMVYLSHGHSTDGLL